MLQKIKIKQDKEIGDDREHNFKQSGHGCWSKVIETVRGEFGEVAKVQIIKGVVSHGENWNLFEVWWKAIGRFGIGFCSVVT